MIAARPDPQPLDIARLMTRAADMAENRLGTGAKRYDKLAGNYPRPTHLNLTVLQARDVDKR